MSYITPARRRFKIGQRVVSTPLALKNGAVGCKQFGVVVGFSDSPLQVRIRRDDYKSETLYHIDFWKKTKNPCLEPEEG